MSISRAVIERDHAAPDAANQIAIVGRDQHGRAPRVHLAQQIHDVERQIRIEIARRLVGKNQHRVVHQRARDGDALLLAARQLLRIRVHPVLQPHPLQHLKRLALLRRDRRAEHARHDRDVFEHGLSRNQLEVLEDEPDAAAVGLHLPRRQPREILSGHRDRAVARQALAQQQAQERRLAGAARAGEEDELPLLDLDGQIAQRVDAAAVKFREVMRFINREMFYCRAPGASSSFTSFGFALPPVAFITWPTRKPNVPVLPPRICATAS